MTSPTTRQDALTTGPRYAVQTLLLPGRDLMEQFANAAAYGYDGVEVAVGPSFDLSARLPELRSASAASGIPVAAICTHPMHDPLHPDQDEQTRRLLSLTRLLGLAEDLGAAGVVSVPIRPGAAFPGSDPSSGADAFIPPAEIDLPYAGRVLGEWAGTLSAGTSRLFLEPLNRFEATLLNRVGQAVDLARAIDHPRVVALADLFHMNIEEADLGQPIRTAGPLLGHVHIADNNRLECGAGCMDFRPSFAALHDIGYRGWISLECFSTGGPRVTDPASESLPRSVAILRETWRAVAGT
ncbi:MAG: hypothetical protein AVDCRST_MAG33-235 [uncultured Thermomicrobiales bacterium]|uniref:Xylose isomerase-like TIM barrel domain-containing protein n=1 Tax=uncultured Thermomicrobiales bacterium TaxID=1645740 RepID=A0A6J4U841_9BACT|nr:MAG: hypothetical protein AVDCRST_MAG33-235 [uncultured Thermomicrobiales bacterium]